MSQQPRPKLIVNPTLELTLDVRLRLPGIRGPSRFSVKIGDEIPADVVRLVLALKDGADPNLLPPEQAGLLVQYGVLVSENADLSPLGFLVPLDADLPALVPYRERLQMWKPRTEEYVLNPTLTMQTDDAVPPSFIDVCPSLEKFSSRRPVAWCADPGTEMPVPFWPIRRLVKPLESLLAGTLSVKDLPLVLQVSLAREGLLVTRDEVAARRTQWQARCDHARDSLAKDQYVVLREVLHPHYIAALRQHLRELRDDAGLRMGDAQVEKRKTIHNEPFTRFLHAPLARLLNRFLPVQIKPSYCMLGMYYPGAILPYHVDREQCEWNVSIALDAEPETDATNAWPIYLEVDQQPREVRLGLGDMVIYRGTTVPHWRDAQPAGHTTTVCFYHFVRHDFTAALY